MSKHTPLPWHLMYEPEYDGERLGDGSVVGGSTGRDVFTGEIYAVDPDIADRCDEGLPYVVASGIDEADARLIVRAVNSHADLLAACEELLEFVRDERCRRENPYQMMVAAMAAIARAKGD